MSEQLYEASPGAMVQQPAVSHVAEYGTASGVLLVAAAGYVALRRFVRPKSSRPVQDVKEEFHAPPALPDEPIVDFVDHEPKKVKVPSKEMPVPPQPKPNKPKKVKPVSKESKPKLETGVDHEVNRQTAHYLQAFFGISSDNPDEDKRRLDEIDRLARIHVPEELPNNVGEEISQILHKISLITKDDPGKRVTLFNSRYKDQPHGLSVAIALERIGFGTHTAKEQIDDNVELDEIRDVVTTHAELRGKNSIRVDFTFDGKETKVTCVRQDLSKPVSQQDSYESPKSDKDTKRARTRGHDIVKGGDGVSLGRKRGIMPPGGNS